MTTERLLGHARDSLKVGQASVMRGGKTIV